MSKNSNKQKIQEVLNKANCSVERHDAVPSDIIVLDCIDGKLNFARQAYNESALVRDLIDTQKEWIAGHTMRDVADELEELYMK